MARDVPELEAAKLLGVSTKTLQRYRRRTARREPVPHDDVDGRLFYDLAEVRVWMIQHGLTGEMGGPTSPAEAALAAAPGAREDAGLRGDLRRADLEAKRARARALEARAAAEAGLADLDLADRIREADTPEALAALSREVAALVALGRLVPERGKALRELLAEARQGMRVVRERPTEAPDRALVCTEEAVDLVTTFEGITVPELRERALRLVEEVAEEDRAARPVVDTGEPALLDEDAAPAEEDDDA